jgi:hypothetical protein
MKNNRLVVVFSHKLSKAQIEDAKVSLGVKEVVQLDSLAAKSAKQVDPNLSAKGMRELARKLVNEAHDAGATHFYIAGLASLCMYANIYANNNFFGVEGNDGLFFNPNDGAKSLHCVTSTSERVSVDIPQSDGSIKKISSFNHVAWLDVF